MDNKSWYILNKQNKYIESKPSTIDSEDSNKITGLALIFKKFVYFDE